MTMLAPASAAEAYDVLAPAYDALTAGYCHDLWLARIEELALAHGLSGRRVLDVACGTGKSFLPLLDRGYAVEGCDVSAAMVEIARDKAGPRARVLCEDMRKLTCHGAFDLVLCLDDAVNHLLEEDELAATFAGVGANLADDGLFVFDTNTLQTYRTAFATDWVHDAGDRLIAWRGHAAATEDDGCRCAATVDVFSDDAATGVWQRRSSTHWQRHWRTGEIDAALAASGLELVARKGQRRGADIHDDAGAPDNHKLLHLARRVGGRRPS